MSTTFPMAGPARLWSGRARWRDLPGRHPLAADGVLALLFALAGLVSVAATYRDMEQFPPAIDVASRAVAYLGLGAMALPLAVRRRFPLTVSLVVVGALIGLRWLVAVPEGSVSGLIVLFGLYSAAAHSGHRWRAPVLAGAVVAFGVEVVREVFYTGFPVSLLVGGTVVGYQMVVVFLPLLLGVTIRSLRWRERELAERAAELERQREVQAREAVFAERVRIARELHDVVAHHVSVMGVQAGAARRVLERQPDRAAGALSSIEHSSRDALVELHRLLGFLRREDEVEGLAPQPGLDQLDLLVAGSGGPEAVRLVVVGEQRPLPPSLEVSAYRIIQEALTNTRRHAPGGVATVRVTYCSGQLELAITDDGPSSGVIPSAPPAGGGLGLIGMRERVALHGGSLRARPRPGGGFEVRAAFPLTGGVGP